MQRKLAAYLFLSFLSFCFFTFVFHRVANADTLTNIPASPPQLLNGQIISSQNMAPSPTIPLTATAAVLTTSTTGEPVPSPALSQEQNAQATDSPTPTPSLQEQAADNHSPTPTPTLATIQPSTAAIATPTPTPTAAPLPTSSYMIGGQIESAIAPTATPTPTVAPTQVPTSSTDLETLFSKYSSQYSVDENELKKIAKCESGFNTNSNNAGLYLGMFQFAASSWISVRTTMGLDPNPDLRTNAEEAIKTAAFMLSRGQESAWPSCK